MKTWPIVTSLAIAIVAGAATFTVWMRGSFRALPQPGSDLGGSDVAAPPLIAEARSTSKAERGDSRSAVSPPGGGSATTVEDARSSTEPADTGGQPGPKVVVGKQDYDFGKMETDGAGERTFVFTNAGGQPLTLEQGKSSCGCCTCVCETRLPDGGTIRPGESAAVTLRWNIKTFTGAYYQSSTILTNDPERPEVTVRVSGRITPKLRVVPWQLIFSRVAAGQEATGEVYVYGYRAEPLRITGRRLSDPSSSQYFETSIVPLSEDQVTQEEDARSGFLLRVILKPGLPPGPFRQQLTLHTNVDSASTVDVPIQGTIASDISVVGPGWDARAGILRFPAAAGDEGAQRRLLLVVRGPHCTQAEFEAVRVVPEWLEVELGNTSVINNGALSQTPLTVRIPAGSPLSDARNAPREESGQIVMDTNHPRERQLRILVSFAVKD
jgi:hypothetical protein